MTDPGDLDAVLCDSGVGEDDSHVPLAQKCGLGQLHVGVRVVDHVWQDLDQLIPEFACAGAGTPEAEQIDCPGGQDCFDYPGDGFEIQRVISLLQGTAVGLQHVFCRIGTVIGVDDVDGLFFSCGFW